MLKVIILFLVFRKDKIYAYLVSIITVVLLFCVSSSLQTSGIGETENSVETSANSEKLLPIYKVKTEEKKVALTMNCAWNADDIDKILEILEQNNVKITFFMVGDWIDKFPEYVKKIANSGHEIRKP